MNSTKQLENQIKLLIQTEQWQEAYKICNNLLRIDPDNNRVFQYKLQIEKSVHKNNQKNIEKELDSLDSLLENQEFQLYFQKLASFQPYVKEYPIISKKLLEAEQKASAAINQQNLQVFQNIIKQEYVISNEYDLVSIINQLEGLKKLKINNNQVNQRIEYWKNQFIDSQININQGLLNSSRYEEIEIFLLKLKKLLPQKRNLLKMIDQNRKRYQYFKIDSQKDFIYKTLEEAKLLFLKREFDKCNLLCEKILTIDSANLAAKTLKKTNEKLANQYSTKKIDELIISNKENKPTFDPNLFVAI